MLLRFLYRTRAAPSPVVNTGDDNPPQKKKRKEIKKLLGRKTRRVRIVDAMDVLFFSPFVFFSVQNASARDARRSRRTPVCLRAVVKCKQACVLSIRVALAWINYLASCTGNLAGFLLTRTRGKAPLVKEAVEGLAEAICVVICEMGFKIRCLNNCRFWW